MRGNSRQTIFFEDDDYFRWQQLIHDGIERYRHRIHAYCWMPNHIHMAVQAGSAPLGQFMRFVASGFARIMNKKRDRTGHFFERRHRSILVQESEYLRELVRYIHLNPVRAGLVSAPADYPWSSHHAYLGRPCPEWLISDRVLGMFSATILSARRRYFIFMSETKSDTMVQQLRHGDKEDDRIIGDDDWRHAVLDDVEIRQTRDTLDTLISRLCDENGISEDALTSTSRARKYAMVRAEITLLATEQGVATVTEIARRFGRSQPTLSRSVRLLRARQNKL